MIGLAILALSIVGSTSDDGGGKFQVWACAMAEGSWQENRSTAERFLLAYYFPEPSGGQARPLHVQEEDDWTGPEGYHYFAEPADGQTRLIHLAEGADRLSVHTTSFVEMIGPSGDTSLVFKDEDAIAFRISTGPIVPQEGSEFGAAYSDVTFYPWSQDGKKFSGNCAVLVTRDPEAALDDIRAVRNKT